VYSVRQELSSWTLASTENRRHSLCSTSWQTAQHHRAKTGPQSSTRRLYFVFTATVRCYQHGAAGPWQVVTLIAGSKLVAGDDDETFVARSLSITQETTEQHLIVRGDKSLAFKLTINERLRSTFYTIEANCWQTQSNARPLCDSRATCSPMCGWLLSLQRYKIQTLLTEIF